VNEINRVVLWTSFNVIMGRCSMLLKRKLVHPLFISYFNKKINNVPAATAGAAPPVFTPAPPECELRFFSPVTEDDVIKLVVLLPDKQCSSDPMQI